MLRAHLFILKSCKANGSHARLFKSSAPASAQCFSEARRWYSEQQGKEEKEDEDDWDECEHEKNHPLTTPAKQLLANYCSWAGVKPETWEVPRKSSNLFAQNLVPVIAGPS